MFAFVLTKDDVNRHLEEKLAAAIAKWAFYNAGSLHSFFFFFFFSCVHFLIRALQIKENEIMSGRLIKKKVACFCLLPAVYFFFFSGNTTHSLSSKIVIFSERLRVSRSYRLCAYVLMCGL